MNINDIYEISYQLDLVQIALDNARRFLQMKIDEIEKSEMEENGIVCL